MAASARSGTRAVQEFSVPPPYLILWVHQLERTAGDELRAAMMAVDSPTTAHSAVSKV